MHRLPVRDQMTAFSVVRNRPLITVGDEGLRVRASFTGTRCRRMGKGSRLLASSHVFAVFGTLG
jgi:hypothetical protein